MSNTNSTLAEIMPASAVILLGLVFVAPTLLGAQPLLSFEMVVVLMLMNIAAIAMGE